MSITSHLSDDGQSLTVCVSGRFDFSVHQAFAQAYEREDIAPARYVIDLARTTYMDSSALGMLLLLRDYAGGECADISLIRVSCDVGKVLEIANFKQLFHIA